MSNSASYQQKARQVQAQPGVNQTTMRGVCEHPRRAPGYVLNAAQLMPREPIINLLDDSAMSKVTHETRFFEETRKRTNPVIQYDYS